MKYTNKYNYGFELLLLYIAPFISISDDCNSSEDFIEKIASMPKNVMKRQCTIIALSLKRLVNNKDINLHLPSDIRNLAQRQDELQPNDLAPIYEWYVKLQKGNKSANQSISYELSQIKSLDIDQRAIIDSFSNSYIKQSKLFKIDDTLSIVSTDSMWGQSHVYFNNIENLTFDSSISGHIFSIETIQNESNITVNILIDTQYANSAYSRFLCENGWVELTFECQSISCDYTLKDYSKMIKNSGFSGFSALTLAFAELLEKKRKLSFNLLNESEKKLYYLAEIFELVTLYTKIPDNATVSISTDCVLSSQVKFDNTINLLKSTIPNIDETFIKLLNSLYEAYQDEDFKIFSTGCSAITAFVQWSLAKGDGRKITRALNDKFSLATSEFTSPQSFENYFNLSQTHIHEQLQPKLDNAGFSGTFPCYYKYDDNKKMLLLLNFVLIETPVVDENNHIKISYALSFARVKDSNLIKDSYNITTKELDTHLTANECDYDNPHISNYGIIGNKSDNLSITYEYDLEKNIEICNELTNKKMVDIALNALINHNVPREYNQYFNSSLNKDKIKSTWKNYMSIATLISLITLILCYFFLTELLLNSPLMLIVLAICFGAGAILSTIKVSEFKRKIWKH